MDFFARSSRSTIDTTMVKKGGNGGAAADGSGEAVVVTAEMMAPAESSQSDRLQPRRTEVSPYNFVRAGYSSMQQHCHVHIGEERCATQRATNRHGHLLKNIQPFHLTRVHHVLISQEMYIDTGNMLAFDVRPVDAAKLKPDTREAHLVEVRPDVS